MSDARLEAIRMHREGAIDLDEILDSEVVAWRADLVLLADGLRLEDGRTAFQIWLLIGSARAALAAAPRRADLAWYERKGREVWVPWERLVKASGLALD